MGKQKQTSSLRDLLTLLFKHKKKILIIFFAIVAAVTIGSLLLPPTYEAKSSLMVKFGREYIYHPEVDKKFLDTGPLLLLHQEEIINSEIQILTSRDLSEKVVTTLKVENIYPNLAKNSPKMITPLEAAKQFEQDLSVEGIKKSNVIQITFRHKNPHIAAKAVNLLVDFFKEKHIQVYSDSKYSFFEQQLSSYEKKLKESQDNLEAFKQKYHVFSLEEQRTLLLKQRMDLDTALKISQNQVKELQKKILFLKSQMETVSENMEREVINAQAELSSQGVKSAGLRGQIAQLDKEIKTLDLRENELQNLKREISGNERNYKTYLEKLEEARISEDLNRQKMTSISMIQPAEVPVKPVKPQKALNIVLGVILGAVLGFGIALFAEFMTQGLSTPESTERRLGLPVLTTIENKE
jgi:uncharacterized protein involved in exopolysaccharide biosynthesis